VKRTRSLFTVGLKIEFYKEINMDIEENVKGWLRSVTIWGAILGAVVNVAGGVFSLEFPTDFTTVVATSLAGIFSAGIVIYGRVKAVKKIK